MVTIVDLYTFVMLRGCVVYSAYQGVLTRCCLRRCVGCRPTQSKLSDHCRHFPFVFMCPCVRKCVGHQHQHAAEWADGRAGWGRGGWLLDMRALLPPMGRCADVADALINRFAAVEILYPRLMHQ